MSLPEFVHRSGSALTTASAAPTAATATALAFTAALLTALASASWLCLRRVVANVADLLITDVEDAASEPDAVRRPVTATAARGVGSSILPTLGELVTLLAGAHPRLLGERRGHG